MDADDRAKFDAELTMPLPGAAGRARQPATRQQAREATDNLRGFASWAQGVQGNTRTRSTGGR